MFFGEKPLRDSRHSRRWWACCFDVTHGSDNAATPSPENSIYTDLRARALELEETRRRLVVVFRRHSSNQSLCSRRSRPRSQRAPATHALSRLRCASRLERREWARARSSCRSCSGKAREASCAVFPPRPPRVVALVQATRPLRDGERARLAVAATRPSDCDAVDDAPCAVPLEREPLARLLAHALARDASNHAHPASTSRSKLSVLCVVCEKSRLVSGHTQLEYATALCVFLNDKRRPQAASRLGLARVL